MFGKHFMFKLMAALAVAVALAVVGAKTAKAGNPHSAQARSVASNHRVKSAQVHGFRLITDTLGGNGQASLRAGGSLTGRTA